MTNLDPLVLPIVMKAVDFLFDQAAKMLEKQRVSRNPKNKETDNQDSISNKNDVLRAITSVNEAEITHCLDQIETYTNNVHLLERQIAMHGGERSSPVNLVNQWRNNQNALREQIDKLKQLLENASDQKINIPGL